MKQTYGTGTPSATQRAIIERMKQGEELRYLWHEFIWLGRRRENVNRRTFDAMLRAGWIERDTSPGGPSQDCNGDRYRLTSSGQEA